MMLLTADDETNLRAVRVRLQPQDRRDAYLAALGAAAAMALSAVVLAACVILGPPGAARVTADPAVFARALR